MKTNKRAITMLAVFIVSILISLRPAKLLAYEGDTHIYIAQQALIVFGTPELRDHGSTLILWAYNADYYNNFGTIINFWKREGTLVARDHFWNPYSGMGICLSPCKTAKQKAIEYYDLAKKRYAAGKIVDAYEFIGATAHFLADMSVPEHVHNDPHSNIIKDIPLFADGADSYETHMESGARSSWTYKSAQELGPLPEFTDIVSLIENLAKLTYKYPSDDRDEGVDQDKKDWNNLIDGNDSYIADDNLNKIGSVLIPRAIQYTAALYRMFWNQTHPMILTVDRQGDNKGLVSTSDAGINCGKTCEARYVKDEIVYLTATAVPGLRFDRWSGCTPPLSPAFGPNVCFISMDASKKVTAYFVSDSDASVSDSHIAQKFNQAYLGPSVMGSPVNDIHDWAGHLVQDYPSVSGFGRSIMIYNRQKDRVFIVHGDIWTQVYEPQGGVNSKLGLPTSNEYENAEYPDTVRQDFEKGYITHLPDSSPWWQPYYYGSIPSGGRPTIAQTDTGEYPPRFAPGTTFRQWGTGFTPNGYATLHFRKPDNTEYPTALQRLDSIGHFDIAYTPPFSKPPGVYTWWGVDNETGRNSNEVRYEITSIGYVSDPSGGSDSLTVLSPNGGEQWMQGETCEIRWIATGDVGKDVKINLQRLSSDGNLLATYELFDGEDSNYQKQWTVPTDQSPGTKYKIKIRSNVNDSISDRSDYVFTIVAKPPDKPAGPSIANGATKVSINPILKWSPADRATTYDIYFGTSPDPPFAGNQSFTSFSPGPLNYCTKYYWRIDARNSGGATRGDTWQFTTENGGVITGYVKRESDGQPLQGIWVDAYHYNTGAHVKRVQTEADGSYFICGLLTGRYRVRVLTDNTLFIPEYYNKAYTYGMAIPVEVTVGQVTSGVNFNLTVGGMVAGIVTRESDGQPLAGLSVSGYDFTTGDYYKDASTQADGSFTLSGLPGGSCKVRVNTWGTDFVPVYYNGAVNWGSASPVAVSLGGTTSGINFSLAIGGRISGTITRDTDGQPVEGVSVYATDPATGEYCGETAGSGPDGSYEIKGLPTGAYKVRADKYGTDYKPEYYNDAAGADSATPVPVTAGITTPGINFGMAIGGKISGYVTRDSDRQPFEGVTVSVRDYSSGMYVLKSSQTGANGFYEIGGLATGQYRVEADAPGSYYVTEYYNGASRSEEADPVDVFIGQTAQNVNLNMTAGGRISGNVKADSDGSPVQQILVYVQDERGYPIGVPSAWTLVDGSYTTPNLPAGRYLVTTYMYQDLNLVDEYYQNATSSSTATAVSVAVGRTTENIDFGLATGGKVTGVVTAEKTSEPLKDLNVMACPYNAGGRCGNAQTKADGSYEISRLATGSYRFQVSASGTDYVSEYYDNAASYSQAAPVSVASGQTTPNISFGLATGGKISGRVISDDTALPIAGVTVQASDIIATSSSSASAQTQVDGTYTISGLAPGTYLVHASGGQDQVGEYYNNAYYEQATPIVVASEQTVPDINFSLATGGRISGRVTRDSDGKPMQGLEVSAAAYTEGSVQLFDLYSTESAPTAADGTYTIGPLPQGQYRVRVSNVASSYWPTYSRLQTNYMVEYYSDTTDFFEAIPVTVAGGQTTAGIDFGLAGGGRITGRVTKDADGQPVSGASVQAVDTGYLKSVYTTTQADGTYVIQGLTTGNYRIDVDSGDPGLAGEYYNNSQSPNNAALVAVTQGQTMANIDFGLSGGGTISGRILRDSDNQPLNNAYVLAVNIASGREFYGYGSWRDGDDGAYSVSGLPSGNYVISARYSDGKYVTEFYQDAADRGTATIIPVTAGKERTGIDFSLAPAGQVTGFVTDGNGQPVRGIFVRADSATKDNYTWNSPCGYDGAYTLNLPPGSYYITVWTGGTVYAFAYYNNTPDRAGATVVSVTASQTVSGINFTLTPGGSITGVVKDNITNLPVRGTIIYAYASDPDGSYGDSSEYRFRGSTQYDGSYKIDGLPPGTYRMAARSSSGIGYSDKYFENASSYAAAAGVTVNAGQTTPGINFSLDKGGSISGWVRNETNNHPVEGAYVTAYDVQTGIRVGIWAKSGTDGYYEIPGLPAGSYKVQAQTIGPPAVTAWYRNSASIGTATAVAVIPGKVSTNIDFSLSLGGIAAWLNINPNPDDISFPWTLTGPGSYSKSGTGDQILAGLPFGDYTITWGGAAGWNNPLPATETKAFTSVGMTFIGNYVQQKGTVVVNPDPNSINAPWSLAGPNGYTLAGTGDRTIGNIPAGDYNVLWGDVSSLTKPYPDRETKTLVDKGTITFTGLYLPLGDLDDDGQVTIADAILALKVMGKQDAAGIRSNYKTSGADVDGDGRIGFAELVFILQKVAGMR